MIGVKHIILVAFWFALPIMAWSQGRWVKEYYPNEDAPLNDIIESYDNGYLICGKHGANYSKYNWLIKTDVNGEILWEKTIGDGQTALVFLDMVQDEEGNMYLAGSTRHYDSQGDPLVMKLNSCGEKEWCKIFNTTNNHDFASCLALTHDQGTAIVLNFTNPEAFMDCICLVKLSSNGDIEWKKCYNSIDTSQRNEYSLELIKTPDSGFLISGWCYYEDPTHPDLWWLHPYFLKTDSTGNFEWETVVYKETNLHGGKAWNAVISPSGLYYFTSLSHYYNDLNFSSPALAKIDLLGNVIENNDVTYGYLYGGLHYAQFINDSLLAASAGWGNNDEDLWSWAITLDTLGNLMDSLVLTDDSYVSILEITNDGKLLYGSKTYQNNQFDVYLTKLNQNLEQDTVYTMPFVYDSLCPYPILSDTIVPDDCGLIVNIDETLPAADRRLPTISFYPNPASEEINLQFTVYNMLFAKENRLEIFDVFGRKMLSRAIPRNQDRLRIDISAFPAGLYIAIVKSGNNLAARGKFVVAR